MYETVVNNFIHAHILNQSQTIVLLPQRDGAAALAFLVASLKKWEIHL